ncbi:MAG: MBL fold metallo-hydrolase [Crocinitomicaceae bacterium]|nr:MBL fold metallo-hydrolase [Crocinitomicaceae bacterium]
MEKQFLINPSLEKFNDEWQGNPTDQNGRFVNHEFPFTPKMGDVWKWKTVRNHQKKDKKNENFRLPVYHSEDFLHSKEDGICWMGHATFLIRLNGLLLLTDPVFGNIGSLIKRKSELPFSPEQIKGVDYLLISHDHRDHVDQKSLGIFRRNNQATQVLTGLNMTTLLHKYLGAGEYQEAGWFQSYRLKGEIEIIYLPARHWSRRGLKDTNLRLWGSFLIRTKTTSIFFGADSGYGSHFGEIRRLFGSPRIAIIGIGPYKPEWFMSPSHTSPADAIRVAENLGADYLIPMHYGTFDLADEPLGDPLRELLRIRDCGKYACSILPLIVGQGMGIEALAGII